MTRGQLIDLDASSSVPLSLGDLSQARTLETVIAHALVVIEMCCAPTSIQVVWVERGTHLLGAAGAPLPLQQPDDSLLATFEGGEPAFCDSRLFVPLLVRGNLCGWLFLSGMQPGSDSSVALQSISTQLAPLIALHLADMYHGERIRHLQTLTEIGHQLSGILDLDRLLDAIYVAVQRVVHVDNFYLAFYEPANDTLELTYMVRNNERIEHRFRWRASEGLAGLVLRQRTPLATNDYLGECARQGLLPRSMGDFPICSVWLGVPLIANDLPIGVLNLCSERDDLAYRPDQIELLAAIGAQAAAALSNARLYRRSERQAQQLATLNHIGRSITSSLDPDQVPSLIMEQVCTLLDVEEGSLLLADDGSGDLVFTYTVGPVGAQLLGQRIPRGRGIAGHVITTGESLIVNDAQGDHRFYNKTDQDTGYTTRAILAVPLRGVAGTHGVIEILNRRDGSHFTHDDRRLLEAVADQAVIALENARRFDQIDQALARRAQELAGTNAMLQHNLQSLTALNALSMAIATSLRDPREIFIMTARGVMEASGALGAAVMLPDGAGFQTAVRVGTSYPTLPVEQACEAVMRNGRPELVEYNHPTLRTLFAVPLRAPQRIIGVLCVFHGDRQPDASDQETMVLFATQAAAAVESLDLFAEVRGARDQMASILASTREGILLVAPDRTIALANMAVAQLTNLEVTNTQGDTIESFLGRWNETAAYAPEDWLALRGGLANILGVRERFAGGHLNTLDSITRSIEWAALPVHGSHAESGGALVVLRDITEAREAERMRQDLTNMIVHDLRSPLSSVMAAIDMLVKGIAGDVQVGQRSILGIAYSSAMQMLDMINTLLDISRLEDGHMPIAMAANPIGPVVERAVERLSTLAQDRAIAILTDLPDNLPSPRIDRDMVVRVVQNLLGNALKFSSRGSTVLVQVGMWQGGNEPMLCLAIKDRGIGIAQKDQEKVFTKFGQVGESRGGTGLGLTFCKLAIKAHGGNIWLESELGVGSTFFFTLPLA